MKPTLKRINGRLAVLRKRSIRHRPQAERGHEGVGCDMRITLWRRYRHLFAWAALIAVLALLMVAGSTKEAGINTFSQNHQGESK